jgi:hypothetical protein
MRHRTTISRPHLFYVGRTLQVWIADALQKEKTTSIAFDLPSAANISLFPKTLRHTITLSQ